MQGPLERQKGGRHHPGGRDRRHLRQHRRRAEREDQQQRDLGGQPDVVIIGAQPGQVTDRDQQRHGKEPQPEHDGRRDKGDPSDHRARKPGQREGADPGDPATLGGLARVPAALQPEEQPDRQGKPEASEDLKLIHQVGV